jgi:hypothetical protein
MNLGRTLQIGHLGHPRHQNRSPTRGVTRAGDHGGFPGIDQDDHGIWTTDGGDQVVWFKDSDGNTLSLTQPARR